MSDPHATGTRMAALQALEAAVKAAREAGVDYADVNTAVIDVLQDGTIGSDIMGTTPRGVIQVAPNSRSGADKAPGLDSDPTRGDARPTVGEAGARCAHQSVRVSDYEATCLNCGFRWVCA